MKYKAIIWGCRSTFMNSVANIFKEVDKGNLEIIGITDVSGGGGNGLKNILGYRFIKKEDLTNYNFDLIIACSSHNSLPSIYKEGQALGIPREKFLRSDVFSLLDFDLSKYMTLRRNPVSIIAITCCGARLYHKLDLPFSSPTIKMAFSPTNLNKLAQNLPYLLSQKLQFKEWS